MSYLIVSAVFFALGLFVGHNPATVTAWEAKAVQAFKDWRAKRSQ